MDPQLVQRTRYLLKARVRHALRCPPSLFPAACKQLVTWVQAHPILSGIASGLDLCRVGHQAELDRVMAWFRSYTAGERPEAIDLECVVAPMLDEHAALCYDVVKTIAAATGNPNASFLINLMQSLLDGNQFAKTDEQLEVVRDVAVDGFYEYLDEHLDSRNAVMGLLLKYKQRSEWFRRERLRAIAAAGLEGQRPGELSLAVDMREYVFDEGVEFTIEPTSASGEADLVLRDTSGEHIVIDAKYLPPGVTPSVIKEKLAAGFHQVARYCDDFQEPSGYLVVFINDARTPRLQLDERDGFRFLTVKGKVVYYVPISIADLPSASKSGPAQEIDVAQDELLRLIEAAAGTAGAAEPKNAEASS